MIQASIPALVLSLVDDLPSELVLHLATHLEMEPALDWPHLFAVMKSAVPQLDAQERVNQFIQGWRALPNPPPPHEMALLFQSVTAALEHQRKKQKIELIWTGPKSRHTNIRRTDQSLIELINTAQSQIIIVSFAVYKVRNILSALDRAALRGVKILVILESPDESEGKIAYDNIVALGANLREHVRIFIWPNNKRPSSPAGKKGSLHVKCAVADGIRLYLSSANLTDFAMKLNMEMGILLEGKDLPFRIKTVFEDFISDGILSEIGSGYII